MTQISSYITTTADLSSTGVLSLSRVRDGNYRAWGYPILSVSVNVRDGGADCGLNWEEFKIEILLYKSYNKLKLIMVCFL